MRKTELFIIAIMISSLPLVFYTNNSNAFTQNSSENPVETYAVLFDQFPTEVNGTVFCASLELKDSLLALGWLEENITIFLGEENMTKAIILEQLNHLEEVVDENDLVFIYITAHGHTYCRDVLDFNSWFQTEFFQIDTRNKVFLQESCYAGEFIRNFYGECFAMGSVGEYEVAIALIPGENDTWLLTEPPFAGGISSHFWTKSLIDIEADSSLDGVISLDEMYAHSLPKIKDCYEEVFQIDPDLATYVENLVGYTENYPHPRVMDNLFYDLTLNATDFIVNNENYLNEDDAEAPDILAPQTVYFTDEEEVELTFQIRDRSAFDIYCYVDGELDIFASESHDGTGTEFWNYTYNLEVQSNHNYNVSVAAMDDWSNRNENFTLVIFDGETDTAGFEFASLIFFTFPVVILYSIARKRKD